MRRNAGAGAIRALAGQLQEKADQAGKKIKLHTGNEIYYSSETVGILEEKQACTMADSDSRPCRALWECLQRCRKSGRFDCNGRLYIGKWGKYHWIVRTGNKTDIKENVEKKAYPFRGDRCPWQRKKKAGDGRMCPLFGKKYGKEYMERLLRLNPSQVIANRYIKKSGLFFSLICFMVSKFILVPTYESTRKFIF